MFYSVDTCFLNDCTFIDIRFVGSDSKKNSSLVCDSLSGFYCSRWRQRVLLKGRGIPTKLSVRYVQFFQ